MTTIDVLNPEFEARGPSEVFMAARSIPDKPVVITVIDNSKPHAKELMTYIAEGLSDRLPISDIVVHSKSAAGKPIDCLLYTSPSPRDRTRSRMPSSA